MFAVAVGYLDGA